MPELVAPRAEDDPVSSVYDAYREFLVALVCRKFRVPADDALGLVHEVFLSFMRCRGDIANQRAWLVAAACNAARGYWRGRRTTNDSLELIANEGRACDVDVIIRVAEILRKLPERWRRILEMHYLEGRSTKEIAEILHTTPGYAEQLVHEGLVHARAVSVETKCT
jgi:RNA polymerase sigma-70 factor (ECF subfamily)